MGFRQITPKSEVDAYLQDQLIKREKVLIRTLNFVGIQCVNEARTNGDYMDQTGNLRSSIGYAVVKNGVVIHKSRFEQIKSGGEGKKEGLGLISELINSSKSGIVLIVVAGMNYAAYVETSRNVITSSELLAESLVPQLLNQLGFSVK